MHSGAEYGYCLSLGCCRYCCCGRYTRATARCCRRPPTQSIEMDTPAPGRDPAPDLAETGVQPYDGETIPHGTELARPPSHGQCLPRPLPPDTPSAPDFSFTAAEDVHPYTAAAGRRWVPVSAELRGALEPENETHSRSGLEQNLTWSTSASLSPSPSTP